MNHQLDEAFAQGVPAVISVTAGANDLGWDQIVTSCYTGNCNSANIEQKLVTVQTNLVKLMQQIQTRSGGVAPKVVLTGYYNPVSADCEKATNGKLSAYELEWMASGVKALNETIKGVAGAYGATYADINFTGHDICSADPWVQGLTGVAPLHPNEKGQNAIAASVVSVLRPSIL
jgi:lysophospholipase L1-like esterase